MPRRNSRVPTRIARPQHEAVEHLQNMLRAEWQQWERHREERETQRRFERLERSLVGSEGGGSR